MFSLMQVSDVMLSVGTKWRCTPCFLWIALKCGVVMFQPYFFFFYIPPAMHSFFYLSCNFFNSWNNSFQSYTFIFDFATIHMHIHTLLFLCCQATVLLLCFLCRSQ